MIPAKRQFRRQTKLTAVKRVEQGASIQAVAQELKIPEQLLQDWVAAGKSGQVKPIARRL